MLKRIFIFLSVILCLINPNQGHSSAEPEEIVPLHSVQRVNVTDVFRYHYEEISSTQHAAKNHQENLDPTHWSLTTANSQTGGFGYWDRHWVSPEGNVFATYSLPFTPDLMPRLSLLAPTVGLAMIDTLKALGVHGNSIGLRWVNNVLVNDKKIAGCIISGEGDVIQIGIGINVDLSDDVIASIDQPVTSLSHLLGETPFVETVLEMLTNCLVPKLEAFIEERYNPIEVYRKKLLYISDKVRIFDGKDYTTGIFNGVDDQGFLLLKKDGEIIHIRSGKISPKPKVSPT